MTNDDTKSKLVSKSDPSKILKSDDILIPELPADKFKKERQAIFFNCLGAIMFGFNSFQVKLAKLIFHDSFTPANYVIWRSVGLAIVAYYIIYKREMTIRKFSSIKNKFWFSYRVVGNYFSLVFLILCMMYLRVATATCISSMYPALVIVFSVIILKEKLHIRYLIGVLICFMGAALIVLNEKKAPDVNTNLPTDNIPNSDIVIEEAHSHVDIDSSNLLNIIKGTFFGLAHLLIVSLLIIGQKILAIEKITMEEQCLFIGLVNALCGVFQSLLTMNFGLNPIYIIFVMTNGLIYYYGSHFFNESIKNVDLGKVVPIGYVTTLTVFILGVALLGESIYLTDILGSLLILSYNVYNAWFPIK